MTRIKWLWLALALTCLAAVPVIIVHLHNRMLVRRKQASQADKNNILWEAVRSHDVAFAERMLEEGADPNQAMFGTDGHRVFRDPSLLMTAASDGDYPMARLLMAYGAQDRAWSDGRLPLTTGLDNAQFELKFTAGYPAMRKLVPVSPNGYRRVIALLQHTNEIKHTIRLPLTTAKLPIILKEGDDLIIYLEATTYSILPDEKIVDHAGNIWNDYNGSVHVAGLTIPQAEAAFERSLTGLDNPMVRFTCRRRNMIRVNLSEAHVVNQADLILSGNAHLNDALRAAKPLPGADLTRVEVWQTPTRDTPVNFAKYLAHKDAADNPLLQNGVQIDF